MVKISPEDDPRFKAYKYVAAAGLSFSIVTVVTVLCMLPTAYNYVSQVKQERRTQMNYCLGSADKAWSQMNAIKTGAAFNRTRRQDYGGSSYGGSSYGGAPQVVSVAPGTTTTAAAQHFQTPVATPPADQHVQAGGHQAFVQANGNHQANVGQATGSAEVQHQGGAYQNQATTHHDVYQTQAATTHHDIVYPAQGTTHAAQFQHQSTHGQQASQAPTQGSVTQAPAPVASGSCSGCCRPGVPGPQGPQGKPGRPGRNGAPGRPGIPGRSRGPCQTVTRPPCKACPAGPPGPPGPVGDAGDAGPNGRDAVGSSDGPPGEPGPKGPPGPAGKPGSDGTPGPDGQPASGAPIEPGTPGPAGDQGPRGPPGPPGPPGENGGAGTPGPKGPKGPPGPSGADGHPGAPGPDGDSGASGNKGICPKYCSLDGGVFFEDGTQRKL